MKGGYFLFNGRFYKENESVFTLADLQQCSEGFSEFFRAESNEVLFAAAVSAHLIATAGTIGIDLTGLVDPEGKLLRKDVSRLLNKNKLYLAAKIDIQIYQSDNQINMLLSAQETERGFYPIQEPGLLLSFYLEQLKAVQPFSAYSASCGFIRQAARRCAEELNKPNLVILNMEGSACETIDGSFACLENENVIFPAKSSGGYRCAIREQVMQSVKEAGFVPLEKEKISQDDLLQAEELFLFDSCNGIQKVLGLEDRRYFSTKTHLIAEKFSELARKDREEKDKG